MSKTIGTTVGEMTLRDRRGRVTLKKSYLTSNSVLKALGTIRDSAHEEHTKNNVQILIDQIIELNPDL